MNPAVVIRMNHIAKRFSLMNSAGAISVQTWYMMNGDITTIPAIRAIVTYTENASPGTV